MGECNKDSYTVDQLVTDQKGSNEYNDGYWQAQDSQWSQQQSGWPQPQNSSQINAVDDTGDPTSQDCDSPDAPQDTTTGTANGTTTESTESSRPGDEITGRELNTSFSALPLKPNSDGQSLTSRALGVPSEHVLDLEMHARWGRVVASRMRKLKHRRRRRNGEKKAKARAKEALTLTAEKESLTAFIGDLTEAANGWKVVNPRSEKGTMIVRGPTPVVCNAQELPDYSQSNTRQLYRPRLQRPGLKETASFIALLFMVISIGTAFTLSVTADASLQRNALTAAANAAIALALNYMMGIKHGAVIAPLLGIA